MAGRKLQPTLAVLLSGDADDDDALLCSRAHLRSEATSALAGRDWPDSTRRIVAKAYERWRSGRAADTSDGRRAEITGMLGLWLLTMWMLYCTSRLAGQGDTDRRWIRRLALLNRLFADPCVRQFFADLYGFPHKDLDLASASIHRLGTTSFVLRCRSAHREVRERYALKCLLYPYVMNDAIATATEGYCDLYGDPARGADGQWDRHMVRVHRSQREWIWMDFIEGRTLQELLDADRTAGGGPSRFRIDELRRYGVPLLEALRSVPHLHLDLSPSNIMVVEKAPGGEPLAVPRIELIDFGENYLLTQDVSGGRVLAETARHVAPELLGSRGRRLATGYEDLYSVGQILLDIAQYYVSDGGFIRNELYRDAPFMGRFIEDLVDDDAERRLLLVQGAGGSLVDPEARRVVYGELLDRLREGLRAYEVLATVTPTVAPEPGSDAAGRPDLEARALTLIGSLPTMIGAVRRPLAFWKLTKQGTATGKEFRYLFYWVFVCTLGWSLAWGETLRRLHDNALFALLVPSSNDLERMLLHPLAPNGLLHHYLAITSVPQADLEDLLFRVVILTVGLAAARYYLEIFATLTVRRLPASFGSRTVEALMRFAAIWFGPGVIIANNYTGRNWLILGGLAMTPIIANNYACWRLAAHLVGRAEREFSTVRRSDLQAAIDGYAEWWKLMLAYGLVLTGLGLLQAVGLLHDLIEYSLLVIAVNMIKLYRSNCGKQAPGLRASLARAYVSGERLAVLDLRRQRAVEAPQLNGTSQVALDGREAQVPVPVPTSQER